MWCNLKRTYAIKPTKPNLNRVILIKLFNKVLRSLTLYFMVKNPSIFEVLLTLIHNKLTIYFSQYNILDTF
jgi:hypothetical protein